MDAREWTMTKHLKMHDKNLECRRSGVDGPYCVFQKAITWEDYRLPDGSLLHYSRPVRRLVFPLTDTWTTQGKPIDWGIEPVIQRLIQHRPERHQEQFNEILHSYESSRESKERERRSESEAFLKDFRRQFARATNDINTSTLEKTDLRRSKEN